MGGFHETNRTLPDNHCTVRGDSRAAYRSRASSASSAALAVLAYWQEAGPLLDSLNAKGEAAYGPSAHMPANAKAITGIEEALDELTPPTAMLATHIQISFAAQKCNQAINYESQFDEGEVGMAAAIILPFRQECARSTKDAYVEAACYAATVGGFPEEE